MLLAALLLGVLSHGWHHFVDHDCETGGGDTSHACVQCSSLHSAAETPDGNVAIAAAPEPFGLIHATHEAARSVHTPASRSARAPPLA